MTEETIINDVDVSGCCLYKDGICLTDKGKCTSMCDYGAYAREEKLKRLEQDNTKLKEALKKTKENIEPCLVSENCSTCNFDFCANKDTLKIIDEVLKDE